MTSALTAAAAPACVASAAPAPTDWKAAVDNVLAHGTYSLPYPSPPTVGLVATRGPLSGTHQTEYMNLWGSQGQQGKFNIAYVTLISEDWQLESDGNFHVDQWMHALSADGTIDRPQHNYLVETPDHYVPSSGPYPVSDCEAAANLNTVITRLSKYQAPAMVAGLPAPRAKTGVALR